MKPIIHVEESLVVETDQDGGIGSCIGTGTLALRNPAENTTLWTIQFNKHGGDSVSDLNLGELSALQGGSGETRAYMHSERPLLRIKEEIDTLPDKDDPRACNAGHASVAFRRTQKVLIRITLENKYSFPLKNLRVTKVLPRYAAEPDAVPGTHTRFDTSATDATWTLDSMEPGRVVTLDLKISMTPMGQERFTTGEIIVEAEADDSFTGINPGMRSESDDIDLPVVARETDVPGEWDIDAKFVNNSEFDVRLESVKVQMGDNVIVDQTGIELSVEPGLTDALWRQQTRIDSLDYPRTEKEYVYTIVHDVTRHSALKITQAPQSLTVIVVDSVRTFEPAEVPTYTRSALKSVTAIENIGSAEIRRLRVVEILPPYFDVQDIHAVTDKGQNATIEYEIVHKEAITSVELIKKKAEETKPKAAATPLSVVAEVGDLGIGGEVSPSDEETVEESVDVALDTDLTDPTVKLAISEARQLVLKIFNFNLHAGETIRLTCAGYAQKPRPKMDYSGNGTVGAFTSPRVTPHVVSSKDANAAPPVLQVAYRKRSYACSTKYTSQEQGKWQVDLKLTNDGEVPLENIEVYQPLTGADYESHEPATVDATSTGDGIRFVIKSLNPGREMTLTVNVSTQGPLRRQEARIHVLD